MLEIIYGYIFLMLSTSFLLLMWAIFGKTPKKEHKPNDSNSNGSNDDEGGWLHFNPDFPKIDLPPGVYFESSKDRKRKLDKVDY
jgi:hypothetical protein